MVFRLSQKLARKLKLVLTNTASLDSTLLPGKDISHRTLFRIEQCIQSVNSWSRMGWRPTSISLLRRPRTPFALHPLNHSVNGSMNDLVSQAHWGQAECGFAPFNVRCKRNETPMSYLDHKRLREAFGTLTSPVMPFQSGIFSPVNELSRSRPAKPNFVFLRTIPPQGPSPQYPLSPALGVEFLAV